MPLQRKQIKIEEKWHIAEGYIGLGHLWEEIVILTDAFSQISPERNHLSFLLEEIWED